MSPRFTPPLTQLEWALKKAKESEASTVEVSLSALDWIVREYRFGDDRLEVIEAAINDSTRRRQEDNAKWYAQKLALNASS